MKYLAFAAALMIGGTALAQDASTPARDARGIPVVSNPATAPAGANQMPPAGATLVVSPNQQQVFAPQPSAGNYPVCSKTVTDGCVQGHERGKKPG